MNRTEQSHQSKPAKIESPFLKCHRNTLVKIQLFCIFRFGVQMAVWRITTKCIIFFFWSGPKETREGCILRVYSHQESALVHLFWTKYNVDFVCLVWFAFTLTFLASGPEIVNKTTRVLRSSIHCTESLKQEVQNRLIVEILCSFYSFTDVVLSATNTIWRNSWASYEAMSSIRCCN